LTSFFKNMILEKKKSMTWSILMSFFNDMIRKKKGKFQ
jgi:hypothetical protein